MSSEEFYIAPIVEGHGETQAVPLLLRRILEEVNPTARLTINPPLRVKVGSFINDDSYFQKYVELASLKAKARSNGSVLILLDSEDQCPAKAGNLLFARAKKVRPDVHFTVVLAYREYEIWFLAAAASLRGVAGLPNDLQPPPEPEAIRGAKEWLRARMPLPYDEPDYQPRLTQVFDFEQASSVPSFRRCRQKIRLLFSGER